KATGRSTLQLAHSNSRRKSPGQESRATFTRRSDGYNEKSCAADQQSEAEALFGSPVPPFIRPFWHWLACERSAAGFLQKPMPSLPVFVGGRRRRRVSAAFDSPEPLRGLSCHVRYPRRGPPCPT